MTDRANGQGLAGAHVSIMGTTRGTVVRQDGGYRLALPAGRHVLLINYVGYTPIRDTVEVAVAGQSLSKDYSLASGGVQLDAAIVTGTRAADRTVLHSPVPIDVLSAATIQMTGAVETSQMIQLLAPSFNFPRPSIADGTDHIRPSTLRGLGPDQVLVLVNGKRRHTTALVNVNGTIGRGSTGADLNAIPSSSIERIEILRDGAAAQYGSDAIAGVINIILKSDASTDGELEIGQSNTTLPHVYTKLTDGDVGSVSANTGRTFSNGGFLHVTGQWENRGSTNRSLPDTRTQYFAGQPEEHRSAVQQPHCLQTGRRQSDGSRTVAEWRSADVLQRRAGLRIWRPRAAKGPGRRQLAPAERRQHRPLDLSGRLPADDQQHHPRLLRSCRSEGECDGLGI